MMLHDTTNSTILRTTIPWYVKNHHEIHFHVYSVSASRNTTWFTITAWILGMPFATPWVWVPYRAAPASLCTAKPVPTFVAGFVWSSRDFRYWSLELLVLILHNSVDVKVSSGVDLRLDIHWSSWFNKQNLLKNMVLLILTVGFLPNRGCSFKQLGLQTLADGLLSFFGLVEPPTSAPMSVRPMCRPCEAENEDVLNMLIPAPECEATHSREYLTLNLREVGLDAN